nr:hypothetical protein [uncultured Brevundimonas sp.]
MTTPTDRSECLKYPCVGVQGRVVAALMLDGRGDEAEGGEGHGQGQKRDDAQTGRLSHHMAEPSTPMI